MIRRVFLLFFLVTTGFSYAQEGQPDDEPQNGNTVSPQEAPPPEPQEINQPAWPQPFQPSQEVGADSQISFPTDI